MATPTVGTATAGLVALALGAHACASRPHAPTYAQARSAAHPAATGAGAPPFEAAIAWVNRLGGTPADPSWTPTDDGGVITLDDGAAVIARLDAATGAVALSRTFAPLMLHGLFVRDGVVLIAGVTPSDSWHEQLFALDARTLATRWTRRLLGFQTLHATAGRDVVARGRDGSPTSGIETFLYRFDPQTGALRWERDMGRSALNAIDTMYVENRADQGYFMTATAVTAVGAADGVPRWTAPITGAVPLNAVDVGPDGVAVTAGDALELHDRATGALRWRRPMPLGRGNAPGFGLRFGPLVWRDRALVVAGFDEPAFALDPATGAEVWRAAGTACRGLALRDDRVVCGLRETLATTATWLDPATGAVVATEPRGFGRVVDGREGYECTDHSALEARDAAAGPPRWRARVGPVARCRVAVVALPSGGRRVVVETDNHTLVGVDPAQVPLPAPSPTTIAGRVLGDQGGHVRGVRVDGELVPLGRDGEFRATVTARGLVRVAVETAGVPQWILPPPVDVPVPAPGGAVTLPDLVVRPDNPF